MRCSEMRWDAMGCSGMRWDGVGCHGMHAGSPSHWDAGAPCQGESGYCRGKCSNLGKTPQRFGVNLGEALPVLWVEGLTLNPSGGFGPAPVPGQGCGQNEFIGLRAWAGGTCPLPAPLLDGGLSQELKRRAKCDTAPLHCFGNLSSGAVLLSCCLDLYWPEQADSEALEAMKGHSGLCYVSPEFLA